MSSLQSLNEKVDLFLSLLKGSSQKLANACTIYYDCVSKDPHAKKVFAQKCPDCGKSWWDLVYDIGAGVLIPEALYMSGAVSAMLKKLPIVEQLKLSRQGACVMIGVSAKIVPLRSLTPDQAVLLGGHGYVASIEEQQLELQRRKEAAVIKDVPAWRFEKGMVYVRRGTWLDKQTVFAIGTELQRLELLNQ